MAARKQVETLAANLGLVVATWAPGDGAVRYRIFRGQWRAAQERPDYFSGQELTTQLGAGAALTWLDGYAVAYWAAQNGGK